MAVVEMARVLAPPGLVFAMMIAVIGCGGGNRVPAKGTVRFEGRALSGGNVTFAPVGGGRPAVGTIGPEGAFVLETESRRGADIGRYQVIVSRELEKPNAGRRIRYVAPRNAPFKVVADRENDFTIDIDRRRGWKIVEDD